MLEVVESSGEGETNKQKQPGGVFFDKMDSKNVIKPYKARPLKCVNLGG
jgi:hypothetical protein